MRRIKTFWRIAFVLVIAVLVFLFWYRAEYSMEISPSYSINTPESGAELMIITQKSDFKDAVVSEVVSHFQDLDVFIRVTDVTRIPELKLTEWNTVVVFHTWEFGKPPKEVRLLLDAGFDDSHMLFFTTSGDGDVQIDGVDGISGASIMSEVPAKAKEVIQKIEMMMTDQHIAY